MAGQKKHVFSPDVPGIHALTVSRAQEVVDRDKPGHDKINTNVLR
jgi:hypothetical protein